MAGMRLRLFLSFVLVVFITVITVVLVARQSAVTEVRAWMMRGGMVDTQDLVIALQDYYAAHESWNGVESILLSGGRGQGLGGPPGSGMMHGMMNQRLRLADADANILVDTSSQSASGQLTRSEREVAEALVVDGKIVGYLSAEGGMGFTVNDQRLVLNRLNRAALTAGLIAGGISILLSFLLASRLLRPVKELTLAAKRLGDGDLSQRVTVQGTDEMALLGQTFNWMAESLQQSEESRRAITADIAHELRNPLAVQRANLEALQDGIYLLTKENLAPVLEQNLMLSRLVEDLRTLAMADSGQLKLERAPTDLITLVEGVVEHFKPQAVSHQVDLLTVYDQESSSYSGISLDSFRVEQILGNLLSNALRYTPDGGRIEVRLQAAARKVLISVHDNGSGIPPEALPHLFERFYRADRSRSRSEGGTGLGLAIALQLAEAHGGTISASNHPQGGALFTLTLPVE
jgi:two-component system OmpR family sensor kinase/two-component system sensor histidine kinase BaeS